MRAQHQALPRFLVHDEIEVTLTIDLLWIRQAVPLLGQRPQRLGHERVAVDPHGDFAGLGFEERALRAENVTEVELLERRVGLVADDVLLHVELDRALLVEDLDELALAHVADDDEAAGHAHRDGVVLSVDVGFERVSRKVRGREIRAERIDARRAQVGQLLPAHRMLVVGDVREVVAH